MEYINTERENTVGIAGTGRMAKALGALLAREGLEVRTAGGRAGAFRELPKQARRIVIAVTDGAIPEVAADLAAGGMRGGIVLHTSGAAGPEALQVLRAAGNATGVLHPLQTVPSAERGVATLPGATYAFAGDAEANEWSQSLIGMLGGKALAVDPKFWGHYHAGAVMACNYQMTLVDAALELMALAGIGRQVGLDALGPILRATVENVLTEGPEKALTGPIRRGDAGTIRRHLAAVGDAAPGTQALYRAAGMRTIAIAERAGLDAAGARAVAAVLESQ